MGEEIRVKIEVDHFFEWLREFEQRVQGLGGGGCWYRSAALRMRVQYSWYQAAVAGRPAVCVGDLQFAEASTGQAFVQAVAACFSYGDHELEAETLVVEHPGSASLGRWLANSAFTPVRAPGEPTHSWYLDRQGSIPSTEEELAVTARTLSASYWDDLDANGPG